MRTPARVVLDANDGVRDVRARGAADVPPPDPARDAREGAQEEVASRGDAQLRRVAVQVRFTLFSWFYALVVNMTLSPDRPCHSTVHRVASNEDLARNFYTLDLLLEREDIQRWRAYVAKQRWGVKRG